LLHLKRFALVEKPKVVKLADGKENAPENAEEPKRTSAVEMAIRKNKVHIYFVLILLHLEDIHELTYMHMRYLRVSSRRLLF